MDEAVTLSSKLLRIFDEAKINVIRCGLHSGGNVEEGFVAGPYHPAFKELCESEIYLDKALELLKDKPKGSYKIFVSSKEISKMTGQKRKNIIKLEDNGYTCKVKALDDLKKYEINIEEDFT